MALLQTKVSRRARQETSGQLLRPPILLLERRTPTWVAWLGAAVAESGAKTHLGSKHRSGVSGVTKFIDIDWKGGILHSGRFLVCRCRCSCATSRLDIPSVHLISHVSFGVMCLSRFDIHLYKGLVVLFCQGSNVQKVLRGRFNTGKGTVG